MIGKTVGTLWWKLYSVIRCLRLWRELLYADVSPYHGLPDSSAFLSPREALEVAWTVWMG
jgi:hypothetical protein